MGQTAGDGQDPKAGEGAGGGTGGAGDAGGAGAGAGGAGAGAGAGGAAGAGAGEGGGGSTDKDKAGEGQQTFDAAYVKTLRDEAAANRKALKDVQGKLKAFEDAQLSESEKTSKRLKELEEENAALLQATRSSEVLAAAAKAGAAHPEVIAKLVGADAEDLASEMERLRKMYPTLFQKGHGSADGGGGSPPPPTKSMNDFIRKAAGRA